jgi:hypothetical protein
MKLRPKTIWICVGLGLLLLGLFAAVCSHHRAKWRLESYKQQLLAQGEKLAIAELIPPMPPSELNGAVAFLKPRALNTLNYVTPMKMVAPGKARVGWRETDPFESVEAKTNVWSMLRPLMQAGKNSREEMREADKKGQSLYWAGGLDWVWPRPATAEEVALRVSTRNPKD